MIVWLRDKSAMKTNETKHCIEEFQSWTVTFLCCTSSSIYSRSQQVVINACQSSQDSMTSFPTPDSCYHDLNFRLRSHAQYVCFWSWNNRSCVTIRIPERPAATRGERIFTPFCHQKKKKNTKSKIALSRYNISSNTSHRFALFRYCTLHQYAVCLCSHVLFTPRPLALLMTETCTLARILPDLIFL